ncbi:MAG: transglycosylase SLT domain-containing protein [Bacteroidota bacterium]
MKVKPVSYPSGTIIKWTPRTRKPGPGFLIVLGLCVILTHLLTRWSIKQPEIPPASPYHAVQVHQKMDDLYLLDQASAFVMAPNNFAAKVRQVAHTLNVPPSWLMAVMYSESRFDANVYNHRGSGAVGLIQFMPSTARDLGISSWELSKMPASEQMFYVEKYFLQVQSRYGAYKDLADFYLAVLYPKARNQDPCYTLYAKPSKAYKQNSGLDENKDGVVTVSDIDKRMKRLFPDAYVDKINA